jgi:hypothetical protein
VWAWRRVPVVWFGVVGLEIIMLPLQGRPIYIQQLGQLQYKKLTELTSEERMIKFHVQVRAHARV